MNFNMRGNRLAIGILVSVLLILSLQFVGTQATATNSVDVLVTHDGSVGKGALAAQNAQVIHEFGDLPIYKVSVPSQALLGIQNMPGVLAVETDQTYTTDVIPNDPDYGQLWGMDKIDAPAAWDTQTGDGSIVVAVIDEGLDITHPDLADNVWANPGETPGDGIDNDNNGYVDDVNGWDFYNQDNTVYDGSGDDHGTHVAGTIGAVGNDGTGVVGVNWNVQLMSLKFLGSQGGSTTDAISAIEYATAMGADVISASWGGGGYSDALKTAIDNFPGLFVAAAGNDGTDNDATPHYPSSYTSDNILAVASSTSSDGMSSFSNYGATSVDIAAPGSNIYSTLPDGTYGSYSGTSMATPHVSGAAALVLAQEPGLSALDLKARLMDYADPVNAFDGKTVSGDRLNVYQSLTLTAPPPPPPTASATFTGTVSPDQVHTFSVSRTGNIDATLSWSTSADLDMYLYEPGADPTGGSWVARAYTLNNPETLSYDASVLGDWQIRVNLYSGSDSSYTLDVNYPITDDTTPPAQVTGLTATAVSDSQIDLAWDANTETDLNYYNIYRDGVLVDTSSTASYSDTGLAAETTYSYTVSAVDTASNEGAESATASATTEAAPVATGMHVQDITLTNPENKGPWNDIQVDVTIVDASGNAVAGATVTIDFEGSSYTATTDSNGLAIFYFDKAGKGGGTYTATVLDVSASGYTYDSGSNVETSDSITI